MINWYDPFRIALESGNTFVSIKILTLKKK